MPHLGHVHLKMSDVDRSVAFYTDVLELSVTERHGRYAFLSFGEHHHDVALQGGRAGRAGPERQGRPVPRRLRGGTTTNSRRSTNR